jgi:hypothetical protein
MKILYLCDRRACEKCENPECHHTEDISHATSFEKNGNGDFFEVPKNRRISYADRFMTLGEKKEIPRLMLQTQKEADDIIKALKWSISNYGFATVAGLCRLISRQSMPEDHLYGWRNIDDACYRETVEGFELALPRAEELNKKK